ncbi:MAG TPA: DUF6152 family protein [Vicinamibacterales bacterium]|nr:DUF6152 family protein [Vicinamibacterales bacterium]
MKMGLGGGRFAQRLVVSAVILHVALTSSAYAHHSHFYDQCKSITIEGRVDRVEFKNLHNLITLRLDDGTAYFVDWLSVTRLTNAGLIGAAKQAVVSGARVVVTGIRIRSAAEIRQLAPKFKGDVEPNTVEARSIRRVDDSFIWPPSPSAYTLNCNGK